MHLTEAVSDGARRRWDLVAFGDPVADIAVAVDAPPPLGGKVVGRRLGIYSGGTTANVACAFAMLGRPAAVCGRVGADEHAPMLRESLQRCGVAIDHLASVPAASSASVIALIAPSGERGIVYMPMEAGPAGDLRGPLSDARLAYVMPYELEPFVALARAARNSGTMIAIDLEPAVASQREAMLARIAHADIVFFNEAGFTAGTGQAPSRASMTPLLDAGPRVVVVTCGASGAMAVDREGFAVQAAFPAKVVDTTGAGDTFNAAFLVALFDGKELAHALTFASAAASFTVAAIGARSGLPDRRAVEALIDSFGSFVQ